MCARNAKYKPSLTLYIDASAIWLEPAKREKGLERISREKRGQLVTFIASMAFLSFHTRIAQHRRGVFESPVVEKRYASSIGISGNVRNQSNRKSPDRQNDIILMYQFALYSHCSAGREAKLKNEPIVIRQNMRLIKIAVL